jgi:ERCC4-type nuclease
MNQLERTLYYMSSILIDYREAELVECLRRRNVPFELASLPVGDIWIGLSLNQVSGAQQEQGLPQETKEDEKQTVVGGLVVERKRITDFEASFLDGRYREQRGRILSYCHTHQAQPIYLLEGAWDSLTGRITKKAMIKLLNRLTLHYQIPILHPSTTDETAEWIECLWEQWKQDPTALKRTNELVKVSDGIHVQKKQNASDPRSFLIACLAQCPGVSVKMAESLSSTYSCLTHIMALTQKELEDHKVGARRIGPAVAKRLWDLLHS